MQYLITLYWAFWRHL